MKRRHLHHEVIVNKTRSVSKAVTVRAGVRSRWRMGMKRKKWAELTNARSCSSPLIEAQVWGPWIHLGGVEIQAGRPDIETLLTDAALATGSGSMSVNGMAPILSCACVWVTDVLGWSSSLWPTKSRGSRSAASSLVGVRSFGGVEGRSECRLVY